jgi:hypothetical protein
MIEKSQRPNFERINYAIRPAKHVERKMFSEMFGRLSELDNIKNFRYIGMGSAYFSDFTLFHKTLGINKLLSIEGEVGHKDRINFNKPFSCIDVEFGYTSDVLPRLPWVEWQEKSIIWLDYTEKLMAYMLGDIEIAIYNILPGSIFMISVNIEKNEKNPMNPSDEKISEKEYRIKKLEENVGRKNIPQRAYEMNLNVDKNKIIIREIINNAILSSVKIRNDGFADDHSKLYYKQLVNLYYKDSADMLTVGGILYDKSQKSKVDGMFKNLDFIREKEQCFNVIVPKLTYREVHALDKILPDDNIRRSGIAKSGEVKIPLSTEDVKNYASIYRYFPTFTESNL